MESVKQKSGILLLDKTIGPTSRQVVNGVSSLLKTKKVGHVGTLDPFASGLLILTVNQATKIGAYLEVLDKTYVAKINLGKKTDTGDLTGQVIASEKVAKNLGSAKINDVLQSFLGKRTQIPPMFSALKREGKPLYKYAREGIEVERKPRNIEIFDIHLISYENDIVEFQSRVSKGTYIRTLGEEIAVALGTLGHLVSLRRTAIGNFKIEDAIPLEDVNFDQLIPMRKALSHLPSIEVDDLVAIDIKNGRSLKLNIDDN
ncbi:MAG TPA: tRNA pseudouridine(55) synthase TruB, partial [Bacilli bacterium]|nr:tRNA pseudouridine(55) synthase TruB [Bacilli bacterium]